jgi:phage tail sheath gpL-like
MAYTTVVVLEHTDKIDGVNDGDRSSIQNLCNFLQAALAGAKRGVEVDIHANDGEASAAASGTVTCASADAADTVTVNGVVFTGAAAEDIGAAEFNVAGTDDEAATSLAACINGSTDALIANIVTASAAADVVTITAVQKGHTGNAITLASSDGTDLAVSGSRLEGGTGGNVDGYNFTL